MIADSPDEDLPEAVRFGAQVEALSNTGHIRIISPDTKGRDWYDIYTITIKGRGRLMRIHERLAASLPPLTEGW